MMKADQVRQCDWIEAFKWYRFLNAYLFTVWVAEFGKWDIKGVFEAGDEELEKKFDRYLNKLVLNVLMSLREDKGDGKPEDILVIVDMEGYTMSQLASAPSKFIARNTRQLLGHEMYSFLDAFFPLSVIAIRYITRKIVELFAIANRRLASGYIINGEFPTFFPLMLA